MNYKKIIAEKINEKTNMGIENIEKLLEIPPKPEMGDYAFPCFQLAKTMRKAPNLISQELKESISKDYLEKVESMGGYLNFFIDKNSYTKHVLEMALSQNEKYGSSDIGSGKNVVVEYSSPNIAKPFHVGHLYSTAVGNALYKMMKSQGYNTIGVNHLGDWGTQFGKLIVAYKRWVDEEALEKEPINELLRIYVKFHDEAEKDPSLEDLARMHFKNLEDGCKEETELWQRMKDLSLKEFNKIYDMLNIKFDSLAGESFYSDKMDAVVDEIEIKGLLTESNGALVVNLDEYNIPPCIIKKSDGATIYATRDLAAAIYRKNTYDFYKNIYVVGSPQALHFKQIFTTLKLMGHDWANDCVHVGFGLVKFADKKLSTRKGDVIFLEDLLNEAVSRTLELIEQKNTNLENKEDVAKKVGIGAVVFAYLKNNRERDIMFSFDDMLNFDGETGPYVQYTYARGKSILRKAEGFKSQADFSKLNSTEEFELVKLIAAFNEAILSAISKYEPSMLTRYIIDVAKAFNKFYNQYSIISCEDEGLKAARLKLVEATTIVLKNGLSLLGIDVVEKM
ncbi:arginyl-tRNA synthetase [Caloramator quimbayensis]|uniref:Arginine--tRNA ligase n=1 Tax=Caloramator quimbayensis TaxID=1147123 RepID=A0A1T4X251_9CLOT|nr:arginine--tRNA ligase [Caloramator quimbayensis]SKA83670.1 arginyl-tRNA synthetase [Caloramator quimbayensis]